MKKVFQIGILVLAISFCVNSFTGGKHDNQKSKTKSTQSAKSKKASSKNKKSPISKKPNSKNPTLTPTTPPVSEYPKFFSNKPNNNDGYGTTLLGDAKTDPLVQQIISKISQVKFKNESNAQLMTSISNVLEKMNIYWINTEYNGWTDFKDLYLSKDYGTPAQLSRTIAHEAGHNVYPNLDEQAFVDTLTEWKVSAAIGYPNQYFKLDAQGELFQLMQYP